MQWRRKVCTVWPDERYAVRNDGLVLSMPRARPSVLLEEMSIRLNCGGFSSRAECAVPLLHFESGSRGVGGRRSMITIALVSLGRIAAHSWKSTFERCRFRQCDNVGMQELRFSPAAEVRRSDRTSPTLRYRHPVGSTSQPHPRVRFWWQRSLGSDCAAQCRGVLDG